MVAVIPSSREVFNQVFNIDRVMAFNQRNRFRHTGSRVAGILRERKGVGRDMGEAPRCIRRFAVRRALFLPAKGQAHEVAA